MYQIKVNGILMPTIYWYLRGAMNTCDVENYFIVSSSTISRFSLEYRYLTISPVCKR